MTGKCTCCLERLVKTARTMRRQTTTQVSALCNQEKYSNKTKTDRRKRIMNKPHSNSIIFKKLRENRFKRDKDTAENARNRLFYCAIFEKSAAT